MIDVYSWATPNGHKVHILLEECGQREGRDWRAIHGPDGKPIEVFESGAMLVYLASKFGRFMPRSDRAKFEVLQWLMFQMGGVGPMLGQAHHFRIYAPEKIDYAYNRYTNEAKRLYGVMDKQIARTGHYIAGKQYTIADIAIFPWLRSWQNQGIDWADYPALKDWFDRIAARPAVQRGVQVLTHLRKPLMDDKAKEALFGATQNEKRKHAAWWLGLTRKRQNCAS
ncbi:MAG: glutathione binding-like protein, partial [Burkholderiaceae bacterium]